MSEPDNKLGPNDKGELAIGLDLDMNGNIRLEFGTPIAWLSMPPHQAMGFARLLMRMAGNAMRAKRSQKLPPIIPRRPPQ